MKTISKQIEGTLCRPMKKANYHIELLQEGQRRTLRFWWRVVCQNGNVLATSDTYTRKATRTRIATKYAAETGIMIRLAKKEQTNEEA